MKKLIKKLLSVSARFKRFCEVKVVYIICVKRLKKQLKINHIKNKAVEGESEYKKVWKKLSGKVEPFSYRLFSNYLPQNLWKYIIPEDIAHNYVDYYLNPPRFREFYSDKNAYDIYLGRSSFLPETLLLRISGSEILDKNRRPVGNMDPYELAKFCEGYDKLILKPSIDTSSGHGVSLFKRNNGVFINNNIEILDSRFLHKFGDDFILQEAIEQHPDLAVFNQTSVNTLRIVAYRSVKDESISIVTSVLRVGLNGAVVDNAHAGGKFVGFNPKTGVLNNYVCDQDGKIVTIHNGIDFSKNQFKIPEWNKIRDAVEVIGKRIIHHRYISFDMTLDKNGNPKLIEFNVSWTGFWLAMFSGQLCLGDKSEEIIEYCCQQKQKS